MNTSLSYILIFFCSYALHSQNNRNVLDTIVDNFQNLTDNQPLDNIYIQTSKDIYETEEDLWFKAYVLDAQHLFPSKRDQVLFVQLINDTTKKAVWEERYEIENGFVDGHIYIQDSLSSGRYALTAYSEHNYFKNQEASYTLKKVDIFNSIKEKVKTPSIKNDTIAQFSLFPEGGYLVSNIKNTLAFKAINKRGLPVEVSGTLFENNTPIIDFKTLHAGMGRIIFTPNISKTYHIELKQNKEKKYNLPELKDSGKVLRLVSNSNSYLSFNVSQSQTHNAETVYLRLQIRGVIYSMASAKLKSNLMVKLPLKDVPQGIAEVTLFNTDFEPVAERLVYVKPNEKLNIKTVLNKSEYETRDKVTLKLKVTNNKNEPVVAHLGLSVFDRFFKNKRNPKNILSHYHLSTQLKGNIYNPSYYFDDANQNRQQALDLLLLTQGWRRYVWNENNLQVQGKQLRPLVFNTLKGKVLAERKKDKKLNMPLYVGAFSGNKEGSKQFIEVDSLKNFSVGPENLKIGEKGYLYLKLFAPEESELSVSFKDVAFRDITNSRKNVLCLYPKYKMPVLENIEPEPFKITSEITELDQVEIKAKKTAVFRDKFIGKLDSLAKLKFYNSDYVCPSDILNCPTPNHYYRPENNRRPVEGELYYSYLILKDGDFYPATVDDFAGKRKWIWKPGFLPPYTYPKYTAKELLELFNLVRMKGYYGKREFYQAVYDEVSIKDPFPDYRNTLLWKPDIITDENGEANVEFYCSDINTIFIGDIEGVSQNGLLGNGIFEFKVDKE